MRNFQEHLKWITSWEDCFWTDETTIFYYTEWLMKVWNTYENLNLLFLIFFNIQYPLKVTVQCLLKFIIRYLPKSYYAVPLLKKPLPVNSASNSRWPPCNFEICFKLYNFLDWLLVLVIVNWGSISRDFPEDVSVLTAAFISLLVFAVVISMISMSRLVFTLIRRLHHRLREACIKLCQKNVLTEKNTKGWEGEARCLLASLRSLRGQ